ncbi:3'-5' exonuclease [Paenibacillus sp. Y412MC10]|uniref:HelD family protein n=1 Tax=Geobacillus sp. (strain Y412MC10) TaxID=481743 RepID=UPI00119DE647|nr:3'-5' exonuclease [Paenibacillus sp. Y412MC10]
MLNQSEADERRYAEAMTDKLGRALEDIRGKISASYRDVIEAKKYMWENISQLDPAERAANKVDISLQIDSGEKAIDKERKLRKLYQSPYFGRVDFRENGLKEADAYYIGIHSFAGTDGHTNLIYDWRSPVASMFYDFGVGPAYFTAPLGRIEGELTVKRQYKIRDGRMEYMIESSINIDDDVLQKELSSTSDEKMKNIVATIQKEQNVIIRNETSDELIIQGVAGSGKTSVALHRIAFLLYRYKETLTSRNVLIISPNKVFSDYISSVLPELGEENMMEMRLEELAEAELKGIAGFQTFYEQVTVLMDQEDPGMVERIRFKATADFIQKLDEFVAYAEQHYFSPEDVQVDGLRISAAELRAIYDGTRRMPVLSRLERTANQAAANLRDEDGQRLSAPRIRKIKAAVKKMFRASTLLALYKDFYDWLGRPELLRMAGLKKLEYSDVFPLIYLKMYWEGTAPFDFVKHLIVDEMQDYTPIQYAVLSRLFNCRKTILGDAGQSVNPYSSSSLAEIKKVFPNADTVELLKSYRSTYEITTFAQQLKDNSSVAPIERHGELPRMVACEDKEEEMERIRSVLREFVHSGSRSMGIVCKTKAQADEVYQSLRDAFDNLYLLDFDSEEFREGIIVTSAHLAKGLEFDEVIVPFVNSEVYRNEMDRSLLYIACTRAMHKLTLTHSGERTTLLKEPGEL